jgi:hypothetical protein
MGVLPASELEAGGGAVVLGGAASVDATAPQSSPKTTRAWVTVRRAGLMMVLRGGSSPTADPRPHAAGAIVRGFDEPEVPLLHPLLGSETFFLAVEQELPGRAVAKAAFGLRMMARR